jgi:hypothetical protein
MAIIRNGLIETNSLFLDSDWYDDGNEVIDETKEGGRMLVKKILALSPAYTLVRDVGGTIIDAVDDPKRRVELGQQAESVSPTLEERVRALEQMQQIMIAQKD